MSSFLRREYFLHGSYGFYTVVHRFDVTKDEREKSVRPDEATWFVRDWLRDRRCRPVLLRIFNEQFGSGMWSGDGQTEYARERMYEQRLTEAFRRGDLIMIQTRGLPKVTSFTGPDELTVPPAPPADTTSPGTDWIEVMLFDSAGQPMPSALDPMGVTFQVQLAGGRTLAPASIAGGRGGIPLITGAPGTPCTVTFKGLDDLSEPVPPEAPEVQPPDASVLASARTPVLEAKVLTRRELAATVQQGSLNATNVFQLRRREAQVIEFEHFNDGSALFLPGAAPATVVRPNAEPVQGIDVLKACLTFAKDFSPRQIVITGHHVRVAQERADCVKALLVGDDASRRVWTSGALASGTETDVRAILTWAAATFGWDCAPDARRASSLSSAIQAFKSAYNRDLEGSLFGIAKPNAPLTLDGHVDSCAWGAFFDCYLRVLRPLAPSSIPPAPPWAQYPVGDETTRTGRNARRPQAKHPFVVLGGNGPGNAPTTIAQHGGGDSNLAFTVFQEANPQHRVGQDDEFIGQALNVPDAWAEPLVRAGYTVQRDPIRDAPPAPRPIDKSSPAPLSAEVRAFSCGVQHLAAPFHDTEGRRAEKRAVEVAFFAVGDEPSMVECARAHGACTSSICDLFDPREYSFQYRALRSATNDTLAPDQIGVRLVSVIGTVQAGVEVELTFANGEKRAGKTGSDGLFQVDGLPPGRPAHLDVPDVQSAPPGPPANPTRVRYVDGGVDVPMRTVTTVELPPVVRRCRMKGMHFEVAKTFLLPTAMRGIRMLVKLYESFSDIVALVNGHTDKQGPAQYNRGLSEERSDAIRAYLTDDFESWMKWYDAGNFSDQWSVREDQFMLATVKRDPSDPASRAFYEGPIDGLLASTLHAYGDFQDSRSQKRTGVPDRALREQLVKAYMALDGTTLPQGAKPLTHGCGLTHPTPETVGSANPNQPANRRVEVFLFEHAVDPSPETPCPPPGCVEYQKWVDQIILDVDLDEEPGGMQVVVLDEHGNVAGAAVHVSGPLVLDGVTVADGTIRFDEIIPGTYKIIVSKDGFTAADATVVIAPGARTPVVLRIDQRAAEIVEFSADQLTVQNGKKTKLTWRVTGAFDHLEMHLAGRGLAKGFPAGKDPGHLTAGEDAAEVVVTLDEADTSRDNRVTFSLVVVPRAGQQGSSSEVTVFVEDDTVPFIEPGIDKTGIRRIGTNDHGRLAVIREDGESVEFYFETRNATHVRLFGTGGAILQDVPVDQTANKGTFQVPTHGLRRFALAPIAKHGDRVVEGDDSPDLLVAVRNGVEPTVVPDRAVTGIRHVGTKEQTQGVTIRPGQDAEIYWQVVDADQVQIRRAAPSVFDPIAIVPSDAGDGSGQGVFVLTRPRNGEVYSFSAVKTASDGRRILSFATSPGLFVFVAPFQPHIDDNEFGVRPLGSASLEHSTTVAPGARIQFFWHVFDADEVKIVNSRSLAVVAVVPTSERGTFETVAPNSTTEFALVAIKTTSEGDVVGSRNQSVAVVIRGSSL